ncbi:MULTISPECIES: carbonic anhydrase [unclassified Leptolyngbya]|uniref:carbonic anhydrase n=1 Tax=unclassified Leptolyngbya TaxID=2650499 RepID=UPI00168A0587|nr:MULTISPECIES: carbonic anhydrase [unclassified Leptolyngbya]MBD1913302.1 carbonic anhydrase [Leptolyngbya sp. FACHB-8]MBD2154391.1 carbonic anhydrase [Leptolyngbya sp. FACHB-16]
MNKTSRQQKLSRRNVLQYGAGIVGASSLTAWLGTGALARTVESRTAQNSQNQVVVATQAGSTEGSLTPDQALAKLMEGNQRFVSSQQLNPNQNGARVVEVAAGQAPFAAILSCADSRVVPEIAFDQGLGDLFVVRVAGNVAITEEIASEEYAVAVLKTPLLVVLGHERCGAVDAAVKGGEFPGVIESLVLALQPAVKASEGQAGDRLTNAIKANVRLQVERLQHSSVIAAAVQEGKLKVVGAYYDLDTGEVSLV